MDYHDNMFDKLNHFGDIKGISNEIPYSLFPDSFMSFCNTTNNTVRSSADVLSAYHKNSKKKNTSLETDCNYTEGRCHRIESIDNCSFSIRKRRRTSYDNSMHNFHQNLSSPQERQAMTLISPEISATSNASLHNHQLQYPCSTSCNTDRKGTTLFVVDFIIDRFQRMLKDTRLRPSTNGIQYLRSQDIELAPPYVLGVGTFSQVTRVSLKRKNSNRKEKDKEYACKQLRQDLMSKADDFVKAATELAYEAYILSCFDHPNIIQLRGIAKDGIASFGDTVSHTQEENQPAMSSSIGISPANSFFLLMDVLEETLDQRIERWKTTARPQNFVETSQRIFEKVSLCRQLANALEYMHSKGVVYRDLKPQNIGFCDRKGGLLKLFDFGLSRELPHSIAPTIPVGNTETAINNPNEHFRFGLSGVVGTIRYMAPEVCLSQPYNRDCDIYSWSIVAWEIWSQTKPFETFTPQLYKTLVCKQGFRPTDQPLLQSPRSAYEDCVTLIPYELESLLKDAWKSEPHQRIRWSEIKRRLDAFQKPKALSPDCITAVMDQHPTVKATDPLFLSPEHELRGVADVSTAHGSFPFGTNDPSIMSNNMGFGEYPRRMTGPVHHEHPNASLIGNLPELQSTNIPSPRSFRFDSNFLQNSFEVPTVWTG